MAIMIVDTVYDLDLFSRFQKRHDLVGCTTRHTGPTPDLRAWRVIFHGPWIWPLCVSVAMSGCRTAGRTVGRIGSRARHILLPVLSTRRASTVLSCPTIH